MAVLIYHTGRSASVDLFLKLRVLKLFMPDLTIILHDFPWPIINFHHFTGLENDILDFQVFNEPNKPCLCNLVHVHASLGQKKKLYMTVALNTSQSETSKPLGHHISNSSTVHNTNNESAFTWFQFHSKQLCPQTHSTLMSFRQKLQIPCKNTFIKNVLNL